MFAPSKEPQNWWDDYRFLAFICLAMALPLVWPTVPPLTDLIGHMGRYKVQLDVGTSPALREWYSFEWRLIGNLGIDLLVIPMSRIFGLELAVKLIAMSIPVLTAAGMLWTAREVHGRIPGSAFFALPLAYGYPFLFGFANFALSMALALLGFALWLRLGRLGRVGVRAAVFLPLGFVIWVCHSYGWGFLGLLAFSAEFVRKRDADVSRVIALFRAGLFCLPLAPPVLLMLLWRSGGVSGGTGDWFNFQAKMLWMARALSDRWSDYDTVCLIVLVGALLVGLVSPRFRFSRTLGAASLILFAVFLLLPRILLGSAFADMRLFPYALAIALIAITPVPGSGSRTGQILACAGLAFLAIRLVGNTASFALYAARHERALAALDHVPRGARLVSYANGECGYEWPTQRLEHLPAMAIVRREAFSNDQWAMAGAQLLKVRKDDAPRFMGDSSQIVIRPGCVHQGLLTLNQSLAALPRSAFDYIWLLDPQALDPKLLYGTTRIWTNGTDALYRINRSQPGSSESAP